MGERNLEEASGRLGSGAARNRRGTDKRNMWGLVQGENGEGERSSKEDGGGRRGDERSGKCFSCR